MSDSTARAPEPSMEDILASIRRIIDEEDTRDGRPSSDSAFDSDGRSEDVDTTIPVMAPAVANREQEASAPVAEAETAGESGGESIFPERESLFWSRATGRGAPVPGPTDEDEEKADEASGGTGGTAMAGAAAMATAGAAAVGGSATDIFTRAQNKLGSTTARVSSTRERMQDLAARKANRTEEMADEALDPIADLADLDDVADDALPDFSAVEEEDAPDVLELTDTVGEAEESVADHVAAFDGTDRVARAMPDGDDAGNDDDADADDYETAFDTATPLHVVEAETPAGDAGDEVQETSETVVAQDDVFDLTMPLETDAEVEVGDDADSAAGDMPVMADSDGLPEIGPGERLEDEYSARVYGDDHVAEGADIAATEEPVAETPDHDDGDDAGEDDIALAGSVANGDGYEVSEIEAADAVAEETPEDDESGADVAEQDVTSDDIFVAATSEDEAADDAGWGLGAAALTAGAAAGAATDFYGARNDRAEADDRVEDSDDVEEPLGFSDTFSASDVYHDDPPALDDDYSASLDREEEPVMARAGFAGDDAFDDGSSSAPQRDDEMDTVGGLVRDAMERDPVDYADPSALVSMSSEEISARALASLADVEGEASRRMYGALQVSEGGASESIEGMVKGMLRPMLREWLDDNLPNMVETMVRGEVERISAKSRKYSRASDDD